VVLAGILLIAAVSGCSYLTHGKNGKDQPASPPASPAVPGGVPIAAPTGRPAICTGLAGSASLRNLSSAMSRLAVAETAKDGAAGVRAAAADFRALAPSAPGTLSTALLKAATRLDLVADHAMADPAEVVALSQDLTEVGKEAQAICGFTLGEPVPDQS
jgi:hypothetical protein